MLFMNVCNNIIDNKIKELNAIKSIFHRDFIDNERRFNKKDISNRIFEKHKLKYDSKIVKVKNKKRKLEEKIR